MQRRSLSPIVTWRGAANFCIKHCLDGELRSQFRQRYSSACASLRILRCVPCTGRGTYGRPPWAIFRAASTWTTSTTGCGEGTSEFHLPPRKPCHPFGLERSSRASPTYQTMGTLTLLGLMLRPGRQAPTRRIQPKPAMDAASRGWGAAGAHGSGIAAKVCHWSKKKPSFVGGC